MAPISIWVTAFALVWMASMPALADDACDLRYRVTPRYDTVPRRLDVELSFLAEGRHESWLRVQSGWAGIKDFGTSLSAAPEQDGDVGLLASTDLNRWRVVHAATGPVTVRYQIRAALTDPDDGTVQGAEQLYRTQIGRQWFQFFGYGALPSVEAWGDMRKGRMCLSVQQPEGPIGPLLGSYFDGEARPYAEIKFEGTHAQLRHAFYAGGPGWRAVEHRLPSGPVVVASRGGLPQDDGNFDRQVTHLLDVHRRFWGDADAPRQTVVRIPNNSRANFTGTLVHQVAVLQVSQDPAASVDSMDFLIGHENLHLWLPNRLGGRASSASAEQAAKDYWLSEGFTNYYAHRLLLTAQLWSLDRYAAELTNVLGRYWRSASRNATADSIAPRFFSDRDAGNQMYARGELLAMGWDRELRTRKPAGLDGLLRGLLLAPEQAANADPAVSRVLQALTRDLGVAAQARVQKYVNEGQSLELDEGLAGPCFALDWHEVPRWVLGFDPVSFAKHAASGVVPGGPAEKAGLREGMVLSGWSVYGGDPEREVVLRVQSDGVDKELRYRPVDGTHDRLPLLTVVPGAANDAACLAWMRG